MSTKLVAKGNTTCGVVSMEVTTRCGEQKKTCSESPSTRLTTVSPLWNRAGGRPLAMGQTFCPSSVHVHRMFSWFITNASCSLSKIRKALLYCCHNTLCSQRSIASLRRRPMVLLGTVTSFGVLVGEAVAKRRVPIHNDSGFCHKPRRTTSTSLVHSWVIEGGGTTFPRACPSLPHLATARKNGSASKFRG
jgi:hypothetical protein